MSQDDHVLSGARRPESEQCPLCHAFNPELTDRVPIRVLDAEYHHHPMDRCHYRCPCGHVWMTHHFTNYLNEYYNDRTEQEPRLEPVA